MSFVDARGPARPFVWAVAGGALTAGAMTIVAALIDGGAVAVEEMPVVVLLVLFFATLVIAIAATLIGLPLTFLLNQARAEEAWMYPAAGLFAGGAIPIALDRLLTPYAGTSIPDLLVKAAPFGAVPGCVCGALWWWLYRRHVQEER